MKISPSFSVHTPTTLHKPPPPSPNSSKLINKTEKTMMPSFSLSSSSSVSTTMKVDKATSELLAGPDWPMNIEICDLCNSNHWMAKDMVKGVKRRLKHKNPRVQLLTVTLLETMVKNCGEYIHYQIAERKILDEMVKIVKKKGDLHVREKILMLLDSWQEAFGGPGGKYSQYYWACDELRRFGAQFPPSSQPSAPVITSPVIDQPKVLQIGYDMPSDSSQRLDEAITSDVEGLSLSTLESMKNTFELLKDMLKAVKPTDHMAVKNEVVIDLVDRCRANQKKLMQMITTTKDGDILAQCLEMNDSLQSVLAKHDALASRTHLPDHGRSSSTQQSTAIQLDTKPNETGDKNLTPNGNSLVSPTSASKDQVEQEEDEEQDHFALLSRRHSKTQSGPSQQSGSSAVTDDGPSSSGSNNALALIDAPVPATTTNISEDQNLIDLLSLVLTTSPPSETPEAPNSAPVQNTFEPSFNSYVVPWAQTLQQPQPQPQTQTQPMTPHLQYQFQPMQPQMHPQNQHTYSQYASSYPPPPWEGTSGYGNYQYPGLYMNPNYQGNMNNGSLAVHGPYSTQNVKDFHYPQYGNQPMYSTTQNSANFIPTQTNPLLHQSNSFQNLVSPSMNDNTASSFPMQRSQSLQHNNSFPSKASNSTVLNGATMVTNGSTGISSGQAPFVPSYRLFEDLNVLGSSEGKHKNGPYPSASGNIYQSMVG